MLNWFSKSNNAVDVQPVQMTPLDEYIADIWKNDPQWFKKECEKTYHTQRIDNVEYAKDYLNGNHKILQKKPFIHNNEKVEPKKIILQHASNIVNFQTNYLLKMPITITGKDEIARKFTKAYKKGKFHRTDLDILSDVIKYGDAYEFVYWDKKKKVITSKCIRPENGFPIYNDFSDYVGFIEHFIVDGISYWNIYREDRVEQWTDRGNAFTMYASYPNVSGRLPIHYKNINDIDRNFGKSEILTWIPIVDTLEDLLSKFSDVTHKHANPLITISGEFNFEAPIDSSTVGTAVLLQEGSTLDFKQPKIDAQAFDTAYTTIYNALLDVSSTPSVIMGNKSLANVAEITVAMMFKICDVKATLNERLLRDGIEERFEIMRDIMQSNGERMSEDSFDSLDFVCITDKPKNIKEIVTNLQTAVDTGILSIKSAIEQSPFTNDVQQELSRIMEEEKKDTNNVNVNGMNVQVKNNSGNGSQDNVSGM